MGYDSGSGILTKPFTKIAANGSGDLQLALGRSVKSEIQLVGDVDSNGNDVNAVHIQSKFKPFKDSTVAFSGSGTGSDRELALQNTNLGYIIPSSTYNTLAGVFAAAVSAGVGATLWHWDKPVSGTNPLRALDFDEYDNQCDWPLQYGITPNPAYYNARVANSIEVSDADAAAGISTWDYTDLKKALSVPGGSTINISSAFGTSIWLAVAWAATGSTTPSGAYTLKGSRYTITPPTTQTTYNVLTFFTNVTYTGSATSTTGIHIPCPKGLTQWTYYNKLPFMDRGSYYLANEVTFHLRLEVLQSISYTSIGIQFSNNGSTWSSTVSILATSGTLTRGSSLNRDNITMPTGYLAPNWFRMVWNGNADPQRYTPQTSPTD